MGFFNLFGREKNRDADETVLVQLRRVGADLSKPHEIEFFLYFPTQAAAQEAASRIQKDGFQADVCPAAKGDNWLCYATRTMPPSLSELQKIRRDFESLVAELHGEYDGWGTGAQR